MDLEQIEKLMAKLETSKLKKLVIKKGDFELQLEKEGEVQVVAAAPHSRPIAAENGPELSPKGERGGGRKLDADGIYVTSPMVGTYYASPSPDSPAFVKVGDRVEESTIVCIIEAMKVMNEVKAGRSGVIAEILTENAQPVEFGTKLLRIT
ncbi:MAG TPA: acetyl-CoA carboxylase biotin carboxyl carrier protein [Chlamydiales bacterium]|nr:acetyl-CoA carboxylase biotin carboxyl carrier protein [Chlamydiales bacterium]